MVLVPCKNPRSNIREYQRALIQLKIDIGISKDKFFLINQMSSGSNQNKWYLVQVDMDQSDTVDMFNYGLYVSLPLVCQTI